MTKGPSSRLFVSRASCGLEFSLRSIWLRSSFRIDSKSFSGPVGIWRFGTVWVSTASPSRSKRLASRPFTKASRASAVRLSAHFDTPLRHSDEPSARFSATVLISGLHRMRMEPVFRSGHHGSRIIRPSEPSSSCRKKKLEVLMLHVFHSTKLPARLQS